MVGAQLDLEVGGLTSALRDLGLHPNEAFLEALLWHQISAGADHPIEMRLRLALQEAYSENEVCE